MGHGLGAVRGSVRRLRQLSGQAVLVAKEMEERKGTNTQDSMGRLGSAFEFTSPFVLYDGQGTEPH